MSRLTGGSPFTLSIGSISCAILSIRASELADDFAPLASDDGVAPAPFCASSGEFTAAPINTPIPATAAQATIQSCFFISTPFDYARSLHFGKHAQQSLAIPPLLGTKAQHLLFPNATLAQHPVGIALIDRRASTLAQKKRPSRHWEGLFSLARLTNYELYLRPHLHLVNRLMLHRWNFYVQCQSALISQHAKLRSFSLARRGQFRAQLRQSVNPFAIQRGNHVTCFHAGFFRCRPGIDVAHQNAFAVGRSKIRAELPADVFRIDAQSRTVHQQIAIVPLDRGYVRDWGDFWHFRQSKVKHLRHRGHPAFAVFLHLAKRCIHCLRVSISPHCQSQGAPCRSFADNSPELNRAFHRLAVDLRDHVAGLQAGLRGGTLFQHFSDYHAAFRGELQILCLFGGDLLSLHSQPAPAFIFQCRLKLLVRFDLSTSRDRARLRGPHDSHARNRFGWHRRRRWRSRLRGGLRGVLRLFGSARQCNQSHAEGRNSASQQNTFAIHEMSSSVR